MTYLLLENQYTSISTGIIAPAGAICKIDRYNGNEIHFQFSCNIWVTKAAFSAGLAPIDSLFFTIPTVDVSGINQMYTFLSIQPTLSGTIETDL